MIDGLFRKSKSSGRLKLVAKKPVVLVLGTGWGAHSLVKVGQQQERPVGQLEQASTGVCFYSGFFENNWPLVTAVNLVLCTYNH